MRWILSPVPVFKTCTHCLLREINYGGLVSLVKTRNHFLSQFHGEEQRTSDFFLAVNCFQSKTCLWNRLWNYPARYSSVCKGHSQMFPEDTSSWHGFSKSWSCIQQSSFHQLVKTGNGFERQERLPPWKQGRSWWLRADNWVWNDQISCSEIRFHVSVSELGQSWVRAGTELGQSWVRVASLLLGAVREKLCCDPDALCRLS